MIIDTKIEQIRNFLTTSPRHQLIISLHKLESVVYNDVGAALSFRLQSIIGKKRFKMRASDCISEYLSEICYSHPDFGKMIAIENIGILLEPEIGLDFHQLLNTHAKGQTLFLCWPGQIENDTLFFLTKEKGTKVVVKDIAYIAV